MTAFLVCNWATLNSPHEGVYGGIYSSCSFNAEHKRLTAVLDPRLTWLYLNQLVCRGFLCSVKLITKEKTFCVVFLFVNMFLLCYIKLNPLRLCICGLVWWLFTFEVTELWLGDNLSLRWTDVAETVLGQCVMKNCWQLVAGIFELTKSKMVEAPAEICSSRLMEFRNLLLLCTGVETHSEFTEGRLRGKHIVGASERGFQLICIVSVYSPTCCHLNVSRPILQTDFLHVLSVVWGLRVQQCSSCCRLSFSFGSVCCSNN